MDSMDSNGGAADIAEIVQIVKEKMVRLNINACRVHVWRYIFAITRTVQIVVDEYSHQSVQYASFPSCTCQMDNLLECKW